MFAASASEGVDYHIEIADPFRCQYPAARSAPRLFWRDGPVGAAAAMSHRAGRSCN